MLKKFRLSFDNRKFLVFLFVLIASGMGLTMVFLVPPVQAPDDIGHFMRAAQCAAGDCFCYTKASNPGVGGAGLDPALMRFVKPFHPPLQEMTAKQFRDIWSISWSHTKQFQHNMLLAVYPPTFYLPQTLAVKLGQYLDWTVLETMYLARGINLLCAVAICAIALWFIQQNIIPYLVLLLLPMTLFQFSSVSHDACLISSCFLLVSLLTRIEGTYDKLKLLRITAFLMFLLGWSRLPLVVFSWALLLPTWGQGVRPVKLRTRWLYVVGIHMFVGVWNAYCTLRFWSNPTHHPGQVVSVGGQVKFILAQPMSFVAAVLNTLWQEFGPWRDMLIGVLGRLDLRLPQYCYEMGCYALIFVFIGILFDVQRSRSKAFWSLFALGCAAIFVLMFVLYLAWTPVGLSHIEGVQGRYLLCVMPFIVAGIPQLPIGQLWARRLSRIFNVLALYCSLACLAEVPMAILHRYYVAAG